MIINCREPEGNALAIIATTMHYLKVEQHIPQDVLLKINKQLFSAISYKELLDAVVTVTEGEIDFINIPQEN